MTHAGRGIRFVAVAAFATVTAVALCGCASTAGSGGSSSSEAVGMWGDPGAGRMPGLELRADHSLSGTDGCNRLMGTWTSSADGVAFGPIASTMMACEGVDTWLSRAATATVSGDAMTIRDQDGRSIGTLTRTATPRPQSPRAAPPTGTP